MFYLFIELARGIIRARVEAAVSAAAKDHRSAAKLALHAGDRLRLCRLLGLESAVGIERLGVFAVRIIRACRKLAELTVAHHHRSAALFAFYVGKLRLNDQLFILQLCFSRIKLARESVPEG